ncbi:MAG: hypothetical protein ACREDF_04155 [Thermoplasmata archaeon]
MLRPESKGPFYVVRSSLAMVDLKAASGVLGLMTIMSGGKPPSPAAINVSEALAPDAEGAIKILGDEEPSLMTEFALCQDCALMGGNKFALWIEKANQNVH